MKSSPGGWPHLVREVFGSWALTVRAVILLIFAAVVVGVVALVLILRG